MSVILNSDIILTQSFIHAVVKARTQFANWFLIGARMDLKTELPPIFDPFNEEFDDETVGVRPHIADDDMFTAALICMAFIWFTWYTVSKLCAKQGRLAYRWRSGLFCLEHKQQCKAVAWHYAPLHPWQIKM